MQWVSGLHCISATVSVVLTGKTSGTCNTVFQVVHDIHGLIYSIDGGWLSDDGACDDLWANTEGNERWVRADQLAEMCSDCCSRHIQNDFIGLLGLQVWLLNRVVQPVLELPESKNGEYLPAQCAESFGNIRACATDREHERRNETDQNKNVSWKGSHRFYVKIG